MTEEEKNNAYKCSVQMNIPVVYLDKEKIASKEFERMGNYIKVLNQEKDEDIKIMIIAKILDIYGCNKAGDSNFKGQTASNFKPELITSILNEEILRLKSQNPLLIYQYIDKLIIALENENHKYELGRGRTRSDVDYTKYIELLNTMKRNIQSEYITEEKEVSLERGKVV